VSGEKKIKMKNFVFNSGKFPAVGVPTNENFILPTDSFSRRSAFVKAAKPSVTDFTNYYSVKN